MGALLRLGTSTCNPIGSATGPTYTLVSGGCRLGHPRGRDRLQRLTHGNPRELARHRDGPGAAAPAAHLVTARGRLAGRSATFSFTATGTASGFQCALVARGRNGRTPSPSYSACSSPKATRT